MIEDSAHIPSTTKRSHLQAMHCASMRVLLRLAMYTEESIVIRDMLPPIIRIIILNGGIGDLGRPQGRSFKDRALSIGIS